MAEKRREHWSGEDYFTVPVSYIDAEKRKELSRPAQMTLLKLARHADHDTGETRPSVENIANAIFRPALPPPPSEDSGDVDPHKVLRKTRARNVRRALDELKRKGWIEVVAKGGGVMPGGRSGRATVYRLLNPGAQRQLETLAQGAPNTGAQRPQTLAQDARKQWRTAPSRQNIEQNIGTEHNNTGAAIAAVGGPASAGSKVDMNSIESIRDAYPKHRQGGSVRAMTAIRDALSRIQGERGGTHAETIDWLLVRVQAYAHSPLGKTQYCQKLANWLDDGGYDEAPEAWDRQEMSGPEPPSSSAAYQRELTPDQIETSRRMAEVRRRREQKGAT